MRRSPEESYSPIISAFWFATDQLDRTLFQPDPTGRFRPIPPGRQIPTLPLLNKALLLALSPRPQRTQDDIDLVRGILTRLIREGQDHDPASPTHGVFRRFLGPQAESEPLHANWATFGGAALARLLQADPPSLRDWAAGGRQMLERSLRLCVQAILRHWPRMGYSHILLTDIYVVLAAGKLLNDTDLRATGRARLEETLSFIQTTGSFEEFLSPTFTGICLSALVPLADLENDGPIAADCLWLLERLWTLLAHHAHLPTRQLAGPYCRAFSDKPNLTPTLLSTGAMRDLRTATYSYLHLSSHGRFPLSPHEFSGLALPGLFWPLRVPRQAMTEILSPCATPLQHRQLVEWIGRDTHQAASPAEEPPPRFRQTTTYKTARFCIGTVNEFDSWDQRRNQLTWWLDAQGQATGIKMELDLLPGHLNSSFLPEWLFQMAVTFSSVQDGPAVLGAYHMAAVPPAAPGDKLQAPSRHVALGRESLTEPRNPIAWLLGTHWRQPIEPEMRLAKLNRLTIRLAHLGPGSWQPRDPDGLVWTFCQAGICFAIRLASPGRPSDAGLALADHANIDWDWLAPPAIFVPWACWITEDDPADVSLEPLRIAQFPNASFRLDWTSPDGRHLRLAHTATPAPDKVDQPTWAGWINNQPIGPARP